MYRLSIFLKGIIPPLLFAALSFIPLPAWGMISSADAGNISQTIESVVTAIKPSLVRIQAVIAYHNGGRESKAEVTGSGVIITTQGHIVTNHHVVGNCKRIICTLSDRTEVEADLVGTDPLSDIAVIRLRGAGSWPAAVFGDSSTLKAGERVFAMGSPLALSQSVTSGIISNTEMIMPAIAGPSKFLLDGEDVGSMVRWIGHDARIFPGNSGGPLLNSAGLIIGINEISMGLAGAIPGNLAREAAAQIIRNGRVTRSWLGLDLQPLLKSSQRLTGGLISGVTAKSPATAAGIKPGDILLKLAGREITIRFKEDLPVFNQYAASLPVGKMVEAIILRKGRELSLNLMPVERDTARARTVEFRSLGICASDITPLKARELRRSEGGGVIVLSVRSGSPAGEARPKLNENDILTALDGKAVRNTDDLALLTADIIRKRQDQETYPVMVSFDRLTEHYLTVVEMSEKDDLGSGREARKAWLPIAVQVVTRDMAERLGIKGQTGVRITQVYKDSAAERAGLKVGDIILKVDGEGIAVKNPEDTEVFAAMLRRFDIGTVVELAIFREGVSLALKVPLEASPSQVWEMKRYVDRDFEFTTRDIAFMDRIKYDYTSDVGALVESVADGGWAALARLQPGDIIVEADGKPIAGAAALGEVMKAVSAARAKATVFRVMRTTGELFIEVLPAWSDVK